MSARIAKALATISAVITAAASPAYATQALGWTRDSQHFVYQDDVGCEGGTRTLVVVRDAATGTEQTFLLKSTCTAPKPKKEEAKKEEPEEASDADGPGSAMECDYPVAPALPARTEHGGAKELESWKKEHPLAVDQGRETAPNGWAKLASNPDWYDGGPPPDEWCSGKESDLDIGIRAGGKLWTHLRLGRSGYCSACGGDHVSAAVWSPDSHHVAWILQRGHGCDCPWWRDELSLQTLPLVVQVLVPEAIRARALSPVTGTLEKAGFAVASTGPAHERRPQTVIYAAKGFEKDAAKIVGVLPGGARIDVLSWKANADVVVAVGDSAVGR